MSAVCALFVEEAKAVAPVGETVSDVLVSAVAANTEKYANVKFDAVAGVIAKEAPLSLGPLVDGITYPSSSVAKTVVSREPAVTPAVLVVMVATFAAVIGVGVGTKMFATTGKRTKEAEVRPPAGTVTFPV
jgi:hypothetical protein